MKFILQSNGKIISPVVKSWLDSWLNPSSQLNRHVCCFKSQCLLLHPPFLLVKAQLFSLAQTYDQTPGLSYSNFQGLLNALGVGHQPQAGPRAPFSQLGQWEDAEKLLKSYQSSSFRKKKWRSPAWTARRIHEDPPDFERRSAGSKDLTNHHQQSGHPGDSQALNPKGSLWSAFLCFSKGKIYRKP